MFLALIIGNAVARLYYVKCQVQNIYQLISYGGGRLAPLSPIYWGEFSAATAQEVRWKC